MKRSLIYTFCKWLFQPTALVFSESFFLQWQTSQRICASICLLALCSTLDMIFFKKSFETHMSVNWASVCWSLKQLFPRPPGITWRISQLPCERFSCFTDSDRYDIYAFSANHSVGVCEGREIVAATHLHIFERVKCSQMSTANTLKMEQNGEECNELLGHPRTKENLAISPKP